MCVFVLCVLCMRTDRRCGTRNWRIVSHMSRASFSKIHGSMYLLIHAPKVNVIRAHIKLGTTKNNSSNRCLYVYRLRKNNSKNYRWDWTSEVKSDTRGASVNIKKAPVSTGNDQLPTTLTWWWSSLSLLPVSSINKHQWIAIRGKREEYKSKHRRHAEHSHSLCNFYNGWWNNRMFPCTKKNTHSAAFFTATTTSTKKLHTFLSARSFIVFFLKHPHAIGFDITIIWWWLLSLEQFELLFSCCLPLCTKHHHHHHHQW